MRIDPEQCTDLDVVVALSLSDRDARHAWHLRRGVVEFVADVVLCRRSTDIEIATDLDNWLRFFSSKRSLSEFPGRLTVSRGTPDGVCTVTMACPLDLCRR